MESILTSIKKLLGILEEHTHFDQDIIMCINSALAVLTQVGVGPPDGFRIEDASTTWNALFSGRQDLDFIKSYVHLRVRLLFDPPLSSVVAEAMKVQADEFLWRINVAAEFKNGEDGDYGTTGTLRREGDEVGRASNASPARAQQ